MAFARLVTVTSAPAKAAEPGVTPELEARLARIEAIKAVERLQYAFGYYQNRFLFTQQPAMFARRGAQVEFDGTVWRGPAGIGRLFGKYLPGAFGTDGANPRAGLMFDQPLFQPVIDVAADGMSATGLFQTIGRYAVYGKDERWVGGVFRNDYVREDGTWKIRVLRYCTTWSAPYNRGWINAPAPRDLPWMTYRAVRPDGRAPHPCAAAYPEGAMPAFGYRHPVTGQRVGAGL